jgi:hypothetical protein
VCTLTLVSRSHSRGACGADYDRLQSLYADDTPPLALDELKAAATAPVRKQAAAAPARAPATTAAVSATPAAAPAAASARLKGGGAKASGKAGKSTSKPKPKAKPAKGAKAADEPPVGLAAAAPSARAAAAAEPAKDALVAARLAEVDELLSAGLINAEERAAKVRALAAASQPAPPAVAADLVQCAGCGESFLAHLLAKHERSCAAVARPAKKVAFKSVERPLPTPGASMSGLAELEAASAAEALPSELVACEKCGRTFFPDRLPIHQRVCKGTAKGSADAARKATLDEMLATGLITQAEYDAKLG